jgi:hypothetical protein
MVESDADERGNGGLAGLRHGKRHRNPAAGRRDLQYCLLAGALIGLAGSLVMAASKK